MGFSHLHKVDFANETAPSWKLKHLGNIFLVSTHLVSFNTEKQVVLLSVTPSCRGHKDPTLEKDLALQHHYHKFTLTPLIEPKNADLKRNFTHCLIQCPLPWLNPSTMGHHLFPEYFQEKEFNPSQMSNSGLRLQGSLLSQTLFSYDFPPVLVVLFLGVHCSLSSDNYFIDSHSLQ